MPNCKFYGGRKQATTRIHFKTDVFAAVAVVDAKAPYSCHKKLPRGPARVQNEAEVQMKQK